MHVGAKNPARAKVGAGFSGGKITSSVGIGKVRNRQIISELPDQENFSTDRELSAYAGVTPRHVCQPFNPTCKAFAERLAAQGKPSIVIIGAIMNKHLAIIYGVLKHQKPFDPNDLKNQVKPLDFISESDPRNREWFSFCQENHPREKRHIFSRYLTESSIVAF